MSAPGSTPEPKTPDDLPRPLLICGWREWAGLPSLNVRKVKAKIDTGARSSAIHAFNVETFHQGTHEFARFTIHPHQTRDDLEVAAVAQILERRMIRSSNGETSERIVIRTELTLLGDTFPIDLTLANRDAMGFRMLIGREALRERFLVDSSQSFLGGRRRVRRKRPAS